MKLHYISTKLYLFALLFAAAAGLCFFKAVSIHQAEFTDYANCEIRFSTDSPPGFNEWHLASFVNFCVAIVLAASGCHARSSEN